MTQSVYNSRFIVFRIPTTMKHNNCICCTSIVIIESNLRKWTFRTAVDASLMLMAGKQVRRISDSDGARWCSAGKTADVLINQWRMICTCMCAWTSVVPPLSHAPSFTLTSNVQNHSHYATYCSSVGDRGGSSISTLHGGSQSRVHASGFRRGRSPDNFCQSYVQTCISWHRTNV